MSELHRLINITTMDGPPTWLCLACNKRFHTFDGGPCEGVRSPEAQAAIKRDRERIERAVYGDLERPDFLPSDAPSADEPDDAW